MKSPLAIRSRNLQVDIGDKIYDIQAGGECVFIQHLKYSGLKLFYNDRYMANRSYTRQKKAYAYGLAPSVLSCVRQYKLIIPYFNLKYLERKDIIDSSLIFKGSDIFGRYPKDSTFVFYGYVTEVAKMTNPRYQKTDGRIKSLSYLLNKMVFRRRGYTDMAPNNAGWIGDTLVAIDFGDLSV